jgi:hypothetical protein
MDEPRTVTGLMVRPMGILVCLTVKAEELAIMMMTVVVAASETRWVLAGRGEAKLGNAC